MPGRLFDALVEARMISQNHPLGESYSIPKK